MPRYFFHLRQSRITFLDQEGVELANFEEAAEEAARRGRELAAREVSRGNMPRGMIIVANEHWVPILQVPLGDDGPLASGSDAAGS
jgi:hypothetical protein